MQERETISQPRADFHALFDRQNLPAIEAERARNVLIGVFDRTGHRVIREFHDVIEGVLEFAHVQDLHEAGMAAGNRLEAADRIELAKVRPRIAKRVAENHLERAKNTGDLVLGQVNPAITPFADAAQEGVIGDRLRQVKNTPGRSGTFWAGAWCGHC
jgi:hypothetical protein